MLSSSFTLTPTAPFDFSRSLAFIGSFPPARGDQSAKDAVLTKLLYAANTPFLATLRASGTVDQPQLHVKTASEQPVSDQAAATALRRYLSLDDDLRPFYALAESDAAFAPVVRDLYGYHQVRFASAFESAAWAILSTRNRMAVARNVKARITTLFGATLTVDGQLYNAFPTADATAAIDPGDLTAAVGQAQRTTYLRGAAEAFAAVDDDWLHEASDAEVEKWLRGIKGIGPWAAGLVMIRGLGRMARLAVPEMALIEAASKLYGVALDEKSVLALATPYLGYEGYWAHYVRIGAPK